MSQTAQQRLTDLLFSQIPTVVIGSVGVFVVNLAHYVWLLPAPVTALWMILFWLSTLLRTSLVLPGAVLQKLREGGRGRRLFTLAALVHGVAWAVPLYTALDRLPPAESELMLISVAGMAGAALGTSAAHRVAFLCYVAPIAITLPLAQLGDGGMSNPYVAGLWIGYFVSLLLMVRSFSRLIRTNVEAGLRNEELISRLEHLSERDGLTGLTTGAISCIASPTR